MRTPGRTFRSELQHELNKMKAMTLRGKISYFFTYYKHLIVIFLFLCLVGFFIGDWIVESRKDIVLEGFFTNDEWDLFNASQLAKDYRAHFPLEGREDVYFDDTLYIDMEGEITDYSSASAAKISVYIANKELDFIVTSDPVFQYYTGSIPMCDLRDILPADLLDQLEEYLVFASPDGVHEGAYGLDLTASRYVAGIGADQEPLIKDNYILFIPEIAPHKEAIVDYIRFLFRWQ